MTSLAWKVNRLRLMGLAEIAWRVKQAVSMKAGGLGFGLVLRPPAPDLDRTGARFVAQPPAMIDRATVCAAAERILAGQWDVFALRGAPLGFPPQWNRDPKTGTVAPMISGKLINYRSEQQVGNIKYLWEPNRHLELVTLAQAWRLSGDERYRDGVRTLLQSWFDQCPYPQGVHWSSALELAVRLLNWAFAWDLLGGMSSALFDGADGQRFLRQWLDVIYQHCDFIQGYFSRHSSANNHLFGEYAGLFVASVTWPQWPQSARWQAMALRGLEREAQLQNCPDGVNREQAVYYQHEVMDMMLLCLLVGRANGIKFSPAYSQQLERLAEFLAALLDAGGHMPMIGDGDDALMVRLAHQPGWSPFCSLLASCALLFERADFKRKAGRFDEKTAWLFGAEGVALWDGLPAVDAAPPRLAFPDGGYFLLGHRFGRADEVRLVMDCAPLGYLSIAAHGHADALAILLSLGGEEFLVDPGTYTYRAESGWRDYFRSTAAHNTLSIDDCDQSVIGGNFMWLKKARARLLAHSAEGVLQSVEGEHDGYARLADPVTHRRKVELDTQASCIVVTDTVSCAAQHRVRLHWHFSEHCQVALHDGLAEASGQRYSLGLRCEGAEMAVLRGGAEPGPGWISRRYDQKVPTATVACSVAVHGTTTIRTVITFQPLPG